MLRSLLSLALAAAALDAAARPAYPPKRLALVRQVTEVAASPDAKTAYFVTDITGDLELWSVPARGGWPLQLSDLGQQVTGVTVSPDGKSVAFASDYGGNERPDLFVVPAEGGEVLQVTASTRAETGPAWSPDGTRLAYTADPDEEFVFELFVLDLATRESRRLTHERENIHFPLWSPDGRTIAATRTGDDRSGPLILAAADGSSVRRIAPPVEGGILIPGAWSPDGKSLLCLAEDPEGFHTLHLLNPVTGAGRFLGPKGWDIEKVEWTKSGIVFTRNEAGASSLWLMRTPKSRPELLRAAAGRIEDFDLDAKGTRALLVWSDSARAPEVWSLDLKTKALTQATRSMAAGVDAASLSKGRIIRYPSFDGREIHSIYIEPAVKRLGTPPPLVVMVHGGPDWQSFDDFHPLRQSLAEAGFAVLAPNFRGSTGFGRKFLELNRKDWGGGDRRDLIEGVKFLAAKGLADPKRAGITGGSYGGYMTLYALARNQGEWAAGAAAYGMPDLVLDYELSKSRFAPWYEVQMGNPETDAALFKERSAITHLDGLKAPLLIFQGANDTNVPLAEAELVYRRLKKLKREPRLVVYPDEGHGFTRRKNLVDYYEKTVSFFQETLAAKP
jgi:dipeptidyl aminopeptidase/acylaminoacyl peptidase